MSTIAFFDIEVNPISKQLAAIIMKRILLILIFFISLKGYAQLVPLLSTDIAFKEKQSDTISFKLDSILILGMGSSVTRIFLNDLSNIMIKDLSSKKITVSYFYLGRNDEEIKKEYKQIGKAGYKAILFLIPTDTALLLTQIYKNFRSSEINQRPINFNTTTSWTSYQQTFNFQFCRVDKNNEKFWSASLEIDCDPSKKYAAKKVAKKLFDRFKVHKYIV